MYLFAAFVCWEYYVYECKQKSMYTFTFNICWVTPMSYTTAVYFKIELFAEAIMFQIM